MKTLLRLALCLIGFELQAATSISQYGITWTFATDMPTGQYVNGDYWVVGPVTITNITPASTVVSGRTINGTMANPTAGLTAEQGFDSGANSVAPFNAALNVARPGGNDLSAENPLVVAAGTSLVSTISLATAGVTPQLSDAAVLTVVASEPPAGAFRPPYCGSDKTHHWTSANLDFDFLPGLPPVTGTPTLESLATQFSRPWIEVNTEFGGRRLHPANNQPDYGREMSNLVNSAILRLTLNDSNEAKTELYTKIVQYGLDLYGAAVSGGHWRHNGGHNQGRKLALGLAAKAFDDAAIWAYLDAAQHLIFQEDQQTFYVPQSEIDRTTIGTEKPMESLSVSAGNLVATTSSAHGMSTGRVVLLAGFTPSGYNGYYYVLSGSSGSTALLRGESDAAEADLGAASVVGTLTYYSTWESDERTPAEPYLQEHLGLAEWGIRASTSPSQNNFYVDALYRDTNDGPGLGTALAAHLLGLRTAWNWEPFFDYADRQWTRRGSSWALYPTFQKNMWVAYRDYDPGDPPPAEAPAAPSSLTAGTPGFNSVPLTWSDNADDESWFEVEASATSGSGFALVAVVGADVESVTVTALPSGSLRYFRVRAVNAAGNSAYTSEVSATTRTYGHPPATRSRPARMPLHLGQSQHRQPSQPGHAAAIGHGRVWINNGVARPIDHDALRVGDRVEDAADDVRADSKKSVERHVGEQAIVTLNNPVRAATKHVPIHVKVPRQDIAGGIKERDLPVNPVSILHEGSRDIRRSFRGYGGEQDRQNKAQGRGFHRPPHRINHAARASYSLATGRHLLGAISASRTAAATS